ncbi:MAG: phosphatidylglycerophosphatase A [Zetaproteobacteria bacterium CG1_02_49_23]|nr:MAG: phosphatidylglycerophosphatase A [Zetaproteobacteria bacterium CG1_02_49_23]
MITEKFASYDPKRKIAGWIAAGFGSGWLPKAPGTWGSLVSLPPVWWLGDLYGVEAVLWGTLCCTLIGCLVCARVLPHLQSDDPGWIVIDEWAGQWLAFGLIGLFYELSWLNLLLAFVAFRLFDISKPFPIRQIEHVGPAWWAIMADDLLAGIFAGALVLAGFFMVSGL